ncbi:MAG TPA: TonB-dependent receptor, partial [Thermoanaerobaculia bacterium]|nr:TonB-dependent receptor [Thermoanaerobaculia bacterium]
DVEHPFDQTLGFARLGYILSDSHTLSGNLAYEKYEEENFRVGGLVSLAAGQQLNRDNWNLTLEDLGVLSSRGLNELRLQAGTRKYDEPTNSNAVSEWFSSGNTLQTGSNILGDLLGEGDMYELRDTFHWNAGSHGVKLGASVLHSEERLRIDTFQEGLFIYVTDTRALPLAYTYGEGSADVSLDTTRYAVFLQDEWRPRANLSFNAGLRYDLDDGGNNPGFTHPLVPKPREKDTDDYQPRLSFSWDPSNRGSDVVRGGVGMFNGRFLLVPALTELQQNGITGGRISRTRVNGALLGLNRPPFILDPNNPRNTGVLLNPDISLLAPDLETPESVQASLGWTHRFGASRFFLDTEGVWSEGDNEIVIRDVNWRGNATPGRVNTRFNQVNMYTNDGRSEYQALILRLNGTMRQADLVTASVTFADKKNISDDFSPVFPFGYPNDPSNIDAEFGRSQADERYRVVLTGIFHMPWDVTVAPIYEYGSGQPWNHRLGYDFNGDGKNSDRPVGVKRNDEEGPVFRQLSLRLAKGFTLLGDNRFDLIVEGFNVLDNTNYDVNSIDTAEFLSGPTLANPALPFRANPNFGRFRATLSGREIQLGVKWVF